MCLISQEYNLFSPFILMRHSLDNDVFMGTRVCRHGSFGKGYLNFKSIFACDRKLPLLLGQSWRCHFPELSLGAGCFKLISGCII